MFGINRIQEKAKSKEPVIVNYITNKSDYCIKSLKNYINWQKREQKTNYEKIDAEKVSAFLREYPDREIIDINYPLERIDDTKNTLSPFFQKSDTPPNIVIIIAESLGREWIAPSEDAVSFAPFFDSLANSGLYWKNCLTTTPRSFGAVPAVTGSTPFGTKGFQFGIMPKHNSLFTILKNNNYQTNAFYAGQFYFDAIAEYLIEQDIDNMVSFYEDFQNNKTEFNGDFWGYNDGILIEKTISELNSGKFTNPMINLLITISSHEILESNNPYFKEAFRKIDEIISVAPKHRQDYYKERKGRIASFVFLDIQLQNFIHEYSKREDFENTIFIITGDHASGMNMKNNLSIYHVPLVIWSPLVNEHKTFSAIVSHNDIAPSLNALLRDNFNLKTPETVHWVGKSLDTSSTFQSSQKMLFLKYAREIDQILYNNYLYDNGDIYFLDEDMNLNEIEVEKDSIKKELSEKLDIFNYINKYAYLNNKLTSSSLQQQDKYIPIMEFYNEDSINITTPDSTGWSNIVLLPKTKIPKRDKEWEKIKITVSADIKFLNKIHINDYMNLYFECIGTGMNAPHYYTDGIFKSIVNEEIIINEWNELNISKIFYVENATDLEVTVYTYFDKGNMINRSVWKNLMIKIEGV